ncbi:MAG: YncE family protein [Actinomycetota bacterium]
MGRKFLAISLVAMAMGVLAFTFPSDRQSSAALELHLPQGEEALAQERILMIDHSGAISAVDPNSEEVVYRAEKGVVSPTMDLVYAQAQRSVTITAGATGTPLGRVASPTRMELEVASASGRLLAFAQPERPGGTEWMPAGRARTKIAVVATNRIGRTRTYDLEGNYAIEAFSTDDRQLFLLEYMPAKNPWHYGLRRLVLATGEVRDIKRTKQNAPGEMNGSGRLALFSPPGHELYTLYTQQGPNYTHVDPQDARPDEVYAFIHLLNLDGAWTHCIDLPAPFGTGAATTHAMAISEDGSRLYVIDPSSGGVAVVDPRATRVLRAVTADLGALQHGASASVSSDGTLYLAGRHQVLVFDGESLRLLRTFRVARPISGITANADGSKLYAGSKGRLLVLDARTGRRLRTISVRGVVPTQLRASYVGPAGLEPATNGS